MRTKDDATRFLTRLAINKQISAIGSSDSRTSVLPSLHSSCKMLMGVHLSALGCFRLHCKLDLSRSDVLIEIHQSETCPIVEFR